MRKIGVLGLDNWYYTFLLGELGLRGDRFAIAAVHDRNPAHLREFASRFKVEAAGSPEALAARADVEMVVVGSATGWHLSDLDPVLAQKKPVLLAKPLAVRYSDARTILCRLGEAGVAAGMLHNYRFNPVLRLVKSLLDEGAIGKITSLYDVTHAGLPEGWPGLGSPGWYDDRELAGGGGFMDHAAHTVDTMRWLVDSPPVSVSATMASLMRPKLKLEDYGIATYTFENGVVGTIESTWLGKLRGTAQLRITGTEGEILADRGSQPTVTVKQTGGGGRTLVHLVEPRAFVDVVGDLVGNFLDAMEGKGENLVPAEHGAEALRLIEKAYEAAQTGRIAMF